MSVLSYLTKIADEQTQFNESTQEADKQQAPAQQQQNAPAPAQQAPQDVAAVPVAEPATPQDSPGVAAAKEMLAPVVSAAMQGDENAKDIVARTAGEMAASINRQAMAAMGPEDQAANAVVPPENMQPQTPPAPGSTPTAPVPSPSAMNA